jgi:hypothetical protein
MPAEYLCPTYIAQGPLSDLTKPAGMLLSNPTYSPEVTVPYANGEIPVLGDYVKNDLEQRGTVTRLRMASSGDDFVSIRWDDGGPDSPLTPAKDFTLISRRA